MDKPKTVIAIDLDDVLINTGWLRRQRSLLVNKLSRTARERHAGLDQAIPDPFNIELYAKRLFPADKGRASAMASGLNHSMAQPENYVYPGIVQFLANLSHRYSLVLLTYGDRGLQNKKIRYSRFRKYFSQIIITQDHSKKTPLLGLKKRYGADLIFIDNSQAVCRLARSLGIKTVRVRNSDKDAKYFRTVTDKIHRLL